MSGINHNCLSEPTVVCHECNYMVKLPTLSHKQAALCPRCKCSLTTYHHNAIQKITALAICALVFLASSLYFEFLSFSSQGQSQTIRLVTSFYVLTEQNFALLALVQAFCMLIFPGLILLALVYLLLPLHFNYVPPKAGLVINMIFILLPWAMAEVFLIGVLISLVKIWSMADIHIGLSLYAYVLFIICMTTCLLYVDKYQLQQTLQCSIQRSPKLIVRSHSIQTTWALLATAFILYIPANFLPIMNTQSLGNIEASTILGGVIVLWQMGSYPIAIIIFVASVMVPISKLIIMCWLNYSVQTRRRGKCKERIFWYRLTEFIGRWSMIDVFVVAILVSLIQLGKVMSIVPGYAALAFCGVVITTMLSAMTFDSRLIWQAKEKPLPQKSPTK